MMSNGGLGLKKKEEKLQDAIFIITKERSCPIYNIGEEIKVAHSSMSISSYKPVCLYLAEKAKSLTAGKERFGAFSPVRTTKNVFDCGGCSGIIHFEYKQQKDFATLQMKLLQETEDKRRQKHLEKFFGLLRGLPIFAPLEDDALKDLTLLLEFKNFPVNTVVEKKGEPGTYLSIILQGMVGVMGDDGNRMFEMGTGEIFGEMSFLTGEPVTNSIHTLAPTRIALLSTKNFKSVISQFPVLQLFLFKMLVETAQATSLRSGNISSGMTGKLSEISAVDLFQLINSSRKTGTVKLTLGQGKALVYFKEGMIIHARYLDLRDQEAFFALLKAKRGFFSYTRGVPAKLVNNPPVGDFMGLLMAGLQKQDEGV